MEQLSTSLPRRTGVTAVHSLHRFVFTVPDLDVAQSFYSAFGLDVRHDPAEVARACRDLVEWAGDGSLRFRISRTLPLAEAAEAHRLIESRATIGKIVLTR